MFRIQKIKRIPQTIDDHMLCACRSLSFNSSHITNALCAHQIIKFSYMTQFALKFYPKIEEICWETEWLLIDFIQNTQFTVTIITHRGCCFLSKAVTVWSLSIQCLKSSLLLITTIRWFCDKVFQKLRIFIWWRRKLLSETNFIPSKPKHVNQMW